MNTGNFRNGSGGGGARFGNDRGLFHLNSKSGKLFLYNLIRQQLLLALVEAEIASMIVVEQIAGDSMIDAETETETWIAEEAAITAVECVTSLIHGLTITTTEAAR